jgi:hypothetical protein
VWDSLPTWSTVYTTKTPVGLMGGKSKHPSGQLLPLGVIGAQGAAVLCLL